MQPTMQSEKSAKVARILLRIRRSIISESANRLTAFAFCCVSYMLNHNLTESVSESTKANLSPKTYQRNKHFSYWAENIKTYEVGTEKDYNKVIQER